MSDISFLYEDGFDTDQAAEEAGDGDFKPIPKGWYRCAVKSAETQETKAGNGLMFNVRLDVEGPTNAGRVVFDRILVKHPSEDAVSIGRQRFATLARAAGLSNPNDLGALAGKTVEAFVKIEKDDEYGDRNRVSLYRQPAQDGGLTIDSTNDDDIPF